MNAIKFNMALDSGAHTLFNKFGAPTTVPKSGDSNLSQRAEWSNRFNFGYVKKPAFKKYLDKYVDYIATHKKHFEFCVALDIIYNEPLSYEVWDELDRQGVKTMPVLHQGGDPEVSIAILRKYMERTDYIGIGGIGQLSSVGQYRHWADSIFKLLTDKRGKPKWRTHGFAMSSLKLMSAYPWSSVDSSSAFYHGRMGTVCIPVPSSGVFGVNPALLAVTPRRALAANAYIKRQNQNPEVVKKIDAYLESLGLTAQSLAHSYALRDYTNLVYYLKAVAAISEQRGFPLTLYVSGRPGQTYEAFVATLPHLARQGIKTFDYLGTFALPQPTNYFLRHGYYNGHVTYGNDRTALSLKARPALHTESRVTADPRPLLFRA